jgi:protein-disulfide isomerase
VTALTSAPAPDLAPDDHVRGDPSAPLVIVYADFTCPRCAVAAQRLREAPLRTCFRHFAIGARHPRAVPLARATEAAARQGAFWELHDAIYDGGGRFDDPHLWGFAQQIGLDVERLDADRRADDVAERVARDVRSALRCGAATTPALVIAGVLHHGPPDAALLASLTG